MCQGCDTGVISLSDPLRARTARSDNITLNTYLCSFSRKAFVSSSRVGSESYRITNDSCCRVGQKIWNTVRRSQGMKLHNMYSSGKNVRMKGRIINNNY